jgi:hypothetical protein
VAVGQKPRHLASSMVSWQEPSKARGRTLVRNSSCWWSVWPWTRPQGNHIWFAKLTIDNLICPYHLRNQAPRTEDRFRKSCTDQASKWSRKMNKVPFNFKLQNMDNGHTRVDSRGLTRNTDCSSGSRIALIASIFCKYEFHEDLISL